MASSHSTTKLAVLWLYYIVHHCNIGIDLEQLYLTIISESIKQQCLQTDKELLGQRQVMKYDQRQRKDKQWRVVTIAYSICLIASTEFTYYDIILIPADKKYQYFDQYAFTHTINLRLQQQDKKKHYDIMIKHQHFKQEMNINLQQIHYIIESNNITLYNQLLQQLQQYNIFDLIQQLKDNDEVYNILILKALNTRIESLRHEHVLQLINKQIPIVNQNQIYQIVANAAFHLQDNDFLRSLTIPNFIKNINDFICLQIKLLQRFSVKQIRFTYEIQDIYQIFIQQLPYQILRQNICFKNFLTFLQYAFNQRQLLYDELQVVVRIFTDVCQIGNLDIIIIYFKLLQQIIEQFSEIRSTNSQEFCFIDSFIQIFNQYSYYPLKYEQYMILKEIQTVIKVSLKQFNVSYDYLHNMYGIIDSILQKMLNQIESLEIFTNILQILQQNIQLLDYGLTFQEIQEKASYYLQNHKSQYSPIYVYMQYDNIIDKEHQQIYTINIINGIKQGYAKIFSQLPYTVKQQTLNEFESKYTSLTVNQLDQYAQLLYFQINQMLTIENINYFEYDRILKHILFINDREKLNIILQSCFNRIIDKFKGQYVGKHLFQFIYSFMNFLSQCINQSVESLYLLLQSLNSILSINNIEQIMSEVGFDTATEQQVQQNLINDIAYKLQQIQSKFLLKDYENTQLMIFLIKCDSIFQSQGSKRLFQQYLDDMITFYQFIDINNFNQKDMQQFRSYTQNLHYILPNLSKEAHCVISEQLSRIFKQLLELQRLNPQVSLSDVQQVATAKINDVALGEMCEFIKSQLLNLVRLFMMMKYNQPIFDIIQAQLILQPPYLSPFIKLVSKLRIFYHENEKCEALFYYLLNILRKIGNMEFNMENISFDDPEASQQATFLLQKNLQRQVLKVLLSIFEENNIQQRLDVIIPILHQAQEQSLNISQSFKILLSSYNYNIEDTIYLINFIIDGQITNISYFQLLEQIFGALLQNFPETEILKILSIICQESAHTCMDELKKISFSQQVTGKYLRNLMMMYKLQDN